MKRILSMLMAVVLCISLLPNMAKAANFASVKVAGVELTAEAPYYVNGSTAASSDSAGYNAYFDATNGTLTIHNLEIRRYNGHGIAASGDLTLILEGDNSIELYCRNTDSDCNNIGVSAGTLVIRGSGSLSIDATRETGVGKCIDQGVSASKIYMLGGNVEVKSAYSNGVYATQALYVYGGSITVSYASKAFVVRDGKIEISGGKMKGYSPNSKATISHTPSFSDCCTYTIWAGTEQDGTDATVVEQISTLPSKNYVQIDTTGVNHSFTTNKSNLKATEATCTAAATYYVQCNSCDAVSDTITVVVGEAMGHTEVIDAAVEPTDTETGLTEGKHCSVCGKVLVPQDVIPAKGSTGNTTDFASGEGTSTNPYLISTAEHLDHVRNYPSAYFKMIDNITFTSEDFDQGGEFYKNGAGWTPIGNSTKPFTGTFDGDEHTITGLRQNFSSTSDVYGGLFGCTSGATIKGIHITDSNIQTKRTCSSSSYSRDDSSFVGGIAGYIDATTLLNCSNAGIITVNCVGTNYAENCKSYVGGIVGYMNGSSTIQNCCNSSGIQVNSTTDLYSKSYSYVGGIAGYSNSNSSTGSITECKNEGAISSEVSHAGGGSNYTDNIGGIIGRVLYSGFSIENCCNLGDVTGDYNAGGIAGRPDGKIQYCYNAGTIKGKYAGGGIAASVASDMTIQDCYNSGNMGINSGSRGGIIGEIRSSATGCSVLKCYNVGKISDYKGQTNIGGIIGKLSNTGTTVANCYYINTYTPGVGYGSTSGTLSETNTQMREQSTFSGFDFVTVWTMEGNPNYPYPELRNPEMQADAPKLTGLTITGDSAANVPTKGNTTTITLQATGSYQNSYMSSRKDVTGRASWSVEGDPAGVSVSKNGVVTIEPSAAAGTVTVQASFSGKSADHTITLTKENEGTLHAITISGADTVDVPSESESPRTKTYSVTGEDQYGGPADVGTVTWSIDGTAPAGVTIDSENGELSVPNQASGGSVTIKAESGSVFATKTVTISKANPTFTSLKITGIDPKLTVPAVTAIGGSSSTPVTNSYTVKFYDQYGAEMAAQTVNWSVSGNPGVGIDRPTGNLTVKNTASGNSVTITASCDGKTDSRTVSVAKPDAGKGAFIRILKDGVTVTEDSITIPTSDSTDVTYAAEVYNQYGDLLTSDMPAWDITSTTGVSVSGGKVTVDSTASAGSVMLTATSSTNAGLKASVSITLSSLPKHYLTNFEQSSVSITYGDPVTDQTVSSSTGTVKYSSSDLSTVEVNANTGVLTIHKVTTDPVTITATVDEIPGRYAKNTATYTITVNPKQLTITGLTAVDRDYVPGDANVQLKNGILEGKVGNDEVSVTMPTIGIMADAKAGSDKEVAVPKPDLTGADVGNYTLADITGVTVTIRKATPDMGTVTKSAPATIYAGTAPSGITLSRTDTTVAGTLALKAGQTLTVGTNDYKWTFTPSDPDNYKPVTGTIKLTVVVDALTGISVSGKPNKTAYQYGETFDPTGLTVTATYASSATKTLTIDDCTVTNGPMTMGQTSVTLSYTKDGVTKTCEVTGLTVAKAKLDVTGMYWDTNGSPFTYDVGEKSVSLKGTLPAGVTVEKTGDQATTVGEYTASASFALDTDYSAGCYEIVGTNPLTAGWKIEKGTYSGTASKTVNIVKNRTEAQSGTLTAADFFASAPAGAIITAVSPASGAMMSSVSVDSSGNLSYVSNTKINGVDDESYTVTISSTNYKDITDATLVFHPTGKDDADVSISGAPSSKTYGDGDFTLTGHVSEAGSGTGIWVWTSSDPSVLQISGTGDTVTVKVLKSGTASITAKYESETTAGESAPASIPVSKATIKVTAKNQNIYVNDTVPKLDAPVEGAHYTVTGLVGGDALTVSMAYQKNGVEAVPDSRQTGTYDIVIVSAAADREKYDVQTTNGTLTINAKSSHNNNSGNGGHGGVTTYAITVKDAENGEVTADHKRAERGDTITLKVSPDKGYTLESLTVTDQNGKLIPVKGKNDKYTFIMPASKVTVEAAFMEDNSMLNSFVDVPADAYYRDAVLWAAENRITGGTDATHFSPNAICTRAQAVTFLWRAAGSPAPKSSVMPFADVAASAYYYDAVLWAAENGITGGTSATTFSPNANCTRAQIITFLWRSQKCPAADTVNPFTDVAADSYYANAVLWAAENGITGGTTATTFTPNNNCTRAQIVTFLYRCMK